MQIGDFHFERSTGVLEGPNGQTQLRPQAADALSCLLRHAPNIASRDQLRKAVWKDEFTVDFDTGLAAIMAELRRAFGDQSRSYIQTVPKRGYRLIAPVSEVRSGDRIRQVLLALGVASALAALALILTYNYWPKQTQQMPARIAVLPFDDLTQSTEDDRFRWLLADDLIATLGRLPESQVAVVARTPVRLLEDRVGQVVEQLQATHVVEGSYEMTSDSIWRVRTTVFDVNDGVIIASLEREADLSQIKQRDELAQQTAAEVVRDLGMDDNSSHD